MLINVGYDKFEMANLGYSLVHTSCGGVELLYQKFLDDMKDTVNDNIKNFKNPILVEVCTDDPTLDPNISLNFIKTCHMANVDSFTVYFTLLNSVGLFSAGSVKSKIWSCWNAIGKS